MAEPVVDTKVPDLPADATPGLDSLVYTVDDPGGTPVSRKTTLGQLRDSLGLTQASLADANTTMVVNTLYVGSMAGWATANRTYTLPTTAAVGDRIGIFVTAGNSTYALLVTAASGDTLNGVAGGTEWSRIFITNEVVILRCVTANSVWIVEVGGRIPQRASIYLSTASSGEPASTDVLPTDYSGVWSTDLDNAGIATLATGRLTVRRTGLYRCICTASTSVTPGTDKFFMLALRKNGAVQLRDIRQFSLTGQSGRMLVPAALFLTAGDYIDLVYKTDEGSLGLSNAARVTTLTAVEDFV